MTIDHIIYTYPVVAVYLSLSRFLIQDKMDIHSSNSSMENGMGVGM